MCHFWAAAEFVSLSSVGITQYMHGVPVQGPPFSKLRHCIGSGVSGLAVWVEPSGSRSQTALGFRPHTEGWRMSVPPHSQEPGSGLCILGLLFVEKQTYWSARE